MKIIAYSFEAENHCIACTQKRFTGKGDATNGFKDEHGLHQYQKDNEGNVIHAIFSTDEQLEPLHCGDCRKEIKA